MAPSHVRILHPRARSGTRCEVSRERERARERERERGGRESGEGVALVDWRDTRMILFRYRIPASTFYRLSFRNVEDFMSQCGLTAKFSEIASFRSSLSFFFVDLFLFPARLILELIEMVDDSRRSTRECKYLDQTTKAFIQRVRECVLPVEYYRDNSVLTAIRLRLSTRIRIEWKQRFQGRVDYAQSLALARATLKYSIESAETNRLSDADKTNERTIGYRKVRILNTF